MDDHFASNQSGGAKQLSDGKELQGILIDLVKTNQQSIGMFCNMGASDSGARSAHTFESDPHYQTVICIYDYLEHRYSVATILSALHQAAGDVRKALQRILRNTYAREEACDFSIANVYAAKEQIDSYFMVN